MVEIKKTTQCDTRSLNPGEKFDSEILKNETIAHIEAVQKVAKFFTDVLMNKIVFHDLTKLGEFFPFFKRALETGFKNEDFKTLDWWKIHITQERHHLNDRCPEDVNLFDVIEMLIDCVCAGLARTGEVYEIKIENNVLQKAIKNTVDLLINSIEVVD